MGKQRVIQVTFQQGAARLPTPPRVVASHNVVKEPGSGRAEFVNIYRGNYRRFECPPRSVLVQYRGRVRTGRGLAFGPHRGAAPVGDRLPLRRRSETRPGQPCSSIENFCKVALIRCN
jgi:hypothetical protein